MERKNLTGSVMLFGAALIWGLAFAFQSEGMDYMGPFTFTVLRNIIGAAALAPAALLNRERSESNKTLLIAGAVSGTALGAASCLQQYGLLYTTAGKAGFLTALYIIMIPAAGIFLGKRCGKNVYAAVFIALAGVYLLCVNEGLSFGRGDVFELLCAVVFSVQILSVDHFSPRVNVYKFACVEFAAAALTAAVPAVMTESFSVSALRGGLLPLLYTGILSSGAGYTLQICGQRRLNPTVAAIIMSLESCVSVIGGWIILGETLTAREIAGCAVMFAAIILAQLPQGRRAS